MAGERDTGSFQPFVLWQGTGRDNHIYRLIDRGPKREGKNDTQFIFERAAGRDAMYVKRWLPLKPEMYPAAFDAVCRVLGRLLGSQVRTILNAAGLELSAEPVNHLVGCEMIQAALEQRDVRGCDCVGAPGRYGRPDPTADMKGEG